MEVTLLGLTRGNRITFIENQNPYSANQIYSVCALGSDATLHDCLIACGVWSDMRGECG